MTLMKKINNDPCQSIGFLLYEVSRLMRRNFNQRVESLGLTQIQWRAIAYISRLEGCNQATLAEVLEVQPITLTRLIDRLQAAGWIERRPDPRDRRAVQVHLTEKARPLLEIMQKNSAETRKQAMAGISEETYASLIHTLQKMKVNLSS